MIIIIIAIKEGLLSEDKGVFAAGLAALSHERAALAEEAAHVKEVPGWLSQEGAG